MESEYTIMERQLLDCMNGQEISSLYFEGVVGIDNDMVILPFMEGERRKITKKEIQILFDEKVYNEYGTNDINAIMNMEGF